MKITSESLHSLNVSWLRILVNGRIYDTPTNKIICIYSKRDSETNFYSYGRHPDMNYIQHTNNIISSVSIPDILADNISRITLRYTGRYMHRYPRIHTSTTSGIYTP